MAIVFECLKGIRDKCKFRKGQRRRLHSWAFYQLQQFVEYKAHVALVSGSCASTHATHLKPVRTVCMLVFVVKTTSPATICGQRSHADFNAARNIARWGLAVIRGEYSLLSCALPSGGTVGG